MTQKNTSSGSVSIEGFLSDKRRTSAGRPCGQRADNPDFHTGANASKPGLVVIAIGSGMDSYSITPEHAEAIAARLLGAAAAARNVQ